MKRVLVIGVSGAGKSTFARRLGEILKIEVMHLDRLYWSAGWKKMEKKEWKERVAELIQGDEWIMDGNYTGTLDVRVKVCDTVIFLDVPRAVCLWRVCKRALAYRGRTRPDMAEGCLEKVDLEFLRWIWNYGKEIKPQVLKLLAENAEGKNIIMLRDQSEIERFLAEVEAQQAACAGQATECSSAR